MATQAQATNWLNGGWKTDQYAKTIPSAGGLGIDQDGMYGFQCKDFANAYAIYLDAPFPAGNAIVLAEGAPSGWQYVSSPQAGDVAVRDFISGDENYGDVCCVLSVSGNNVKVIGQNQVDTSLTVGHVPTDATYPKSAFKKYLRRKYTAAVATPAVSTYKAIRETNVRSQPKIANNVTSVLQAGNTFAADGVVTGQSVTENGATSNKWVHSQLGHYVWLGNCKKL